VTPADVIAPKLAVSNQQISKATKESRIFRAAGPGLVTELLTMIKGNRHLFPGGAQFASICSGRWILTIR